jgi:hypothetical protein
MLDPSNENPYAAPSAGAAESAYYKTVATRATFRELWWCTRPNALAFLFASLFKIMHLRLPTQFGFAPDRMEMLDPEDLPPGPKTALRDVLAQCAETGLTPRFAETLPCVGDGGAYGVVLVNHDGTIFASANCARFIRRVEVHVSLASLLNNGHRIATTSAPRRLLAPPGVEARYHTGADVADLMRVHRLRLLEIGDAWPVALDDAGLLAHLRDVERQALEFHHGRGVWVRMSIAEMDRVRASAS